jgi:putative DNA primase/helicase
MQRKFDTLDGRWRGILVAAGISPKLLDKKHHPCPFCGGKDRFRFTDYKQQGYYKCNQCIDGGGNGYEFLKRFRGIDDFKEAAKLARSLAGAPDPAPPKIDMGRLLDDRRRRWEGATGVTRGSPVGRWLWRRCGLTEFPSALREAPIAGGGWEMLAVIMDPAGRGLGKGIHRTVFDRDGDFVRRLYMPGELPKGGAVRLADAVEDAPLGIAEGIETALSASALFNMPVWSVLSAVGMRRWQPPSSGIRKIVVFGDNDRNFVGQTAAYDLAFRLDGEHFEVEVKIPDAGGSDWNDVHRSKRRAQLSVVV